MKSTGDMNPAAFDWSKMKNIQKIHRVLYAIGLGPLIGRIILLLTTTGRRSGKKRVTPLQYEKIGGDYFLGAARGLKADWVRNIQACPHVEIRVGAKHFEGRAEVVTDPCRFADFLEVRLARHPRMVGFIMEKAHGLPRRGIRAWSVLSWKKRMDFRAVPAANSWRDWLRRRRW